jgi:hypothetical protein
MTMTASNPHGTGLVVLIWILTSISVIVVSLRVLAKIKIRQFRTDDVVMIFALVRCLPWSTQKTRCQSDCL